MRSSSLASSIHSAWLRCRECRYRQYSGWCTWGKNELVSPDFPASFASKANWSTSCREVEIVTEPGYFRCYNPEIFREKGDVSERVPDGCEKVMIRSVSIRRLPRLYLLQGLPSTLRIPGNGRPGQCLPLQVWPVSVFSTIRMSVSSSRPSHTGISPQLSGFTEIIRRNSGDDCRGAGR